MHLGGDEAGGDLAVVLGLKSEALADQITAHGIVIRERTVMHQTLIWASGEGMCAVGSDRGFGCHACVSDAMRTCHATQSEAASYLIRPPDFLENLHAPAAADHAHCRRLR